MCYDTEANSVVKNIYEKSIIYWHRRSGHLQDAVLYFWKLAKEHLVGDFAKASTSRKPIFREPCIEGKQFYEYKSPNICQEHREDEKIFGIHHHRRMQSSNFNAKDNLSGAEYFIMIFT